MLVTANDDGLKLYDGDTGVAVVRDGNLRAVIADTDGPVEFATSRLADVETMHAMTIHKSQGGQAAVVTRADAAGGLPAADPGTVVHGGNPCQDEGPRGRVGSRSARGPGPPDEARRWASAAPTVMAHVGLGCSGVSMIW
jgi:hypothetical protein